MSSRLQRFFLKDRHRPLPPIRLASTFCVRFPFFSLTLIFGLVFVSGCAREPKDEPKYFGHITSLTGKDSARGEAEKLGILLAIEEADREEGMVLGRRVAAIHADTQSVEEAVRPETIRLLSVNRVVGLLGGPELARCPGLGGLLQNSFTPALVSGPLVGRNAANFLFCTGLDPQTQGAQLARFAATDKQYRKFVVLIAGTDPQSVVADAFEKAFRSDSAVRMTYSNYESLRERAKEIAGRNVDALVLIAPFADSARVRQAGLEMPILYGGRDEVAISNSIPAGEIYALTVATSDAIPEAFVEKFSKRFGKNPTTTDCLAYDDAKWMFAAVVRAKSFDGKKIRDAIAEMTFESQFGPVRFDSDMRVQRPVFLIRIEAGQNKTLRRIDIENPG